jgi:hypothetical protein
MGLSSNEKSGPREVGMDIVVWPLFLLLYLIPVAVLWLVIYSAVLAALRRHDRDRVDASVGTTAQP